jgi:hypothetical protein
MIGIPLPNRPADRSMRVRVNPPTFAVVVTQFVTHFTASAVAGLPQEITNPGFAGRAVTLGQCGGDRSLGTGRGERTDLDECWVHSLVDATAPPLPSPHHGSHKLGRTSKRGSIRVSPVTGC